MMPGSLDVDSLCNVRQGCTQLHHIVTESVQRRFSERAGAMYSHPPFDTDVSQGWLELEHKAMVLWGLQMMLFQRYVYRQTFVERDLPGCCHATTRAGKLCKRHISTVHGTVNLCCLHTLDVVDEWLWCLGVVRRWSSAAPWPVVTRRTHDSTMYCIERPTYKNLGMCVLAKAP